jgi:hypothetical protein
VTVLIYDCSFRLSHIISKKILFKINSMDILEQFLGRAEIQICGEVIQDIFVDKSFITEYFSLKFSYYISG